MEIQLYIKKLTIYDFPKMEHLIKWTSKTKIAEELKYISTCNQIILQVLSDCSYLFRVSKVMNSKTDTYSVVLGPVSWDLVG